MKVLYIIDSFATGGAEKSLHAILQNSKNIIPVVCGIYKDDTLLESFISLGIKTYHFEMTEKYGWRKAFDYLCNLVRTENPAVIHSTLFRSNILARIVAKKFSIPLVNSMVSDSYGDVRQSQMNVARKFKHYFTWLLDRSTASLVTHFAANSQSIKISNSKALGIDPNKVTVIYRGRNPINFMSVGLGEITETKERLNISQDDFIFITVGRLIQSKGHLDIISALEIVRQSFQNVKLFIAGHGPFRSTLEEKIERCGLEAHVKLLGVRDDIPVLLKLSNVFVFATYYEGHSGALIEAMFAEIPAIVSNIHPNLETLDQSMAGIFPTGNIEELASKMKESIIHYPLYKENASKALAHALKLFDIKEVAEAHEQLYHDIVSRKK